MDDAANILIWISVVQAMLFGTVGFIIGKHWNTGKSQTVLCWLVTSSEED